MTERNGIPAEQAGARRAAARSQGGPGQLARRVWSAGWKFFSSVRVALVLVLVLAGLTLIGTLLIQAPADMKADPADFAWWVDNVAKAKVGFWATPARYLGLFDVFHSYWFLGAGAMLVLSIVVCSLNRWAGIRNQVTGTPPRLADGFYEGGSNRARFESARSDSRQAAAAVAGALKRRGYRVRQEAVEGSVYLAADKNRFFRLGTYLSHLSIILLIAGFVLGSYLGFREQNFMVPEGSTRAIGYGSGLTLQLDSFVDEYYPDGPPKDYRSQVVLYKDGKEVESGLIRVNHPMSYGGVRVYQSFFGQAAVMKVTDAQGNVLFDDGTPLGWSTSAGIYKRSMGMFNIGGSNGPTAYVVAPAGSTDPLIKPGQMRVELYAHGAQSTPIATGILEQGETKQLGGYNITFVRERQFSGFQVSKDPGNMLIWIASGLFIVGLVAVFYFPHRQVWARVMDTPGSGSQVLVRTVSAKSFAVASDFESIAEEIGAGMGTERTPVPAEDRPKTRTTREG